MPRLFTGLEIPSDVGQSLATLRGGLPGARWVDPENYHVTLRFIGDVDDVVAHEIASMLGRVRRQAFELRIEDLKSFGGHKPRQIVATLGPAQALMELQAEHERLMQRVGLEPKVWNTPEDGFESFLPFDSRQRRAKAKVGCIAERQVAIVLAPDVEPIGL